MLSRQWKTMTLITCTFVQVSRLICAFVVCILQKQVFHDKAQIVLDVFISLLQPAYIIQISCSAKNNLF